MPNPFQLERLKNIFGPSVMGSMGTPNVGMGPQVDLAQPMAQIPSNIGGQPPVDDFDPAAMMGELYKPQTDATDRFNQLSQNYPQYEKPGFWRAAAGALSSFGPGGHEIGMKVANATNDRNITDWKNQIGPAQAAANLERQENVNNRTLAHNTVQSTLTDRRNTATAKNAEASQKTRQQRADIYEFKSRNPNLKFDLSGPKIKILNPADGSIKVTEWDTGNLTESDKIDLNQKNALARIAASGKVATGLEETRQENRTDLEGTRQTNRVAIAGMPARASSATTRPELPTQTKVRQASAAAQLRNTRPELAKFIKETGTNEFTITPPNPNPGMFGKAGPTQTQYDEIKTAIYGSAGPTVESAPRTDTTGGGGRGARPSAIPSTIQESIQKKAPPGWEYVRKPGGGWTAVKKAGG